MKYHQKRISQTNLLSWIKRGLLIWTAIIIGSYSLPLLAEDIGSVSTRFKLLGANDKIVVEAFDDPDVAGATCYLSRAKTGGISGTVGVAEDRSEASIACRQTGPVTLSEKIKSGKADGDEVFKKNTSLLFKTLQVVRFYDAKRNVLIYLSYSDRVIEGSPQNSISVIPVTPWH
ncbi:CreA protein [Nitrosomonas eutropha]|uniref:CreA protein n=1 Tax=Nitrosomonas eutropha TaxID=916 RepID=A0A1I7I6C5_9PROT|nr:CreA family protein [Nitrosomonas eutropha]SFU68493.1 CreA protein [Nitrosomonas eutropha]